jgi:hypothetical protein
LDHLLSAVDDEPKVGAFLRFGKPPSMIPKKPVPAEAGIADFSDKIMRQNKA